MRSGVVVVVVVVVVVEMVVYSFGDLGPTLSTDSVDTSAMR